MDGRTIAGFLIAATVAITLFNPISAAVDGNSGDVDVTNESLTATPGDYQDLDGYDVKSGSETVYWYNSSSSSYEAVSSPDDYEMNYSSGSIVFNSSGKVSSGDDVKVSYTYAATDGTTSTVVALVPLFVALLVLGIMAAKMMGMMEG
jgi:hypothetical protein